jgi:hypothetical protein
MALAGAALLAAGCGISEPSSDVTDTFSGSVAVGGYSIHSFTIGKNGGEINIKITELSPDSGTSLGLEYGQFPSGSTTECLTIRRQPLAGKGTTAITDRGFKGTYCLGVFDSGFILRPQTYTVTITHP